ncbi:MAG: hypothetical protein WDN30_14425 [Pararobbsia sp.]
MSGQKPPANLAAEELSGYRLCRIEEAVTEISKSMSSLVALEQQHAETREGLTRAFSALSKQEERLRTVEIQMPTICTHEDRLRAVELALPTVKQSSGWIQQAVALVMACLISTLVASIIPHLVAPR